MKKYVLGLVVVGWGMMAGLVGAEPVGKNNRLILTFTCSQWYNSPAAMQKMAEVVHGEGVPVAWILNFETAKAQKAELDRFHKEFGDDVIVLKGPETWQQWRELLPWSEITMAGGARPGPDYVAEMQANGIEGVWGYCDQQIGIDGITHWGCPWGLFYMSNKVPFVAGQGKGLVGCPWTIRDLHKCYHLKNAINFGIDAIEMIRSKTLDRGKDITFFKNLLDELIANTAWNDRVYCCLHEEANGPFIRPGEKQSDEGASPEASELMYELIRQWLRYAKQQGVTIMTLPAAVKEYRKAAGDTMIPSTILTTDKFRGSIEWYADPIPAGTRHYGFGPAGNFPDTLFHAEQDCQLVFVHPEMAPRTLLNYKAQYEVRPNKPYPEEPSLPRITDWKELREGNTRTYTYTLQSFYSMPFGVVEWGKFDGWKVVATNGLWAKIIDNRALLFRMDIDVEKLDHNQRWQDYWVKLEKVNP